MAKYGLFLLGGTKHHLEFEGDKLAYNTNTGIVEISKGKQPEQTVAVIRLAEGQSVKEIPEGTAAARH